MTTNKNDEDVRPIYERSLLESIDLFEDLGKYEDVVEACNQYLEVFPNGDSVEAVREKRREAKLQ